MEKSAELYKEGLAPYILSSGHFNPNIPEYSSEWEFLKAIGVNLCVPGKQMME
jgi:maltose-binding protein MalE